MSLIKSVFDLRVLVAAVFLFIGVQASAFAHAHLVSATPAANGMAMPPPTELRLKFSEGIEPKFTKVKVTASDKTPVETDTVKLDPNDNSVLIVPLKAPLPDGKYTVNWIAVSVDGHKTNGAYSFDSMQ